MKVKPRAHTHTRGVSQTMELTTTREQRLSLNGNEAKEDLADQGNEAGAPEPEQEASSAENA